MNHIQITISVSGDAQDLLIARLSSYDAAGFEQMEETLLVYFEEDNFSSYDVNELLKDFTFQISTIQEKNWNEAWEKDFQPVVMDSFCAIRAHFHLPIEGVSHQIIITPKMSFGTGHHATTYMMVQQMKGMDFAGKTVFDFGTGTGILAILAEKLGAAGITAIDNDPWSINNAKENFEQNSCSRIELFQTADVPVNKTFDVVLANINKNVILDHMAGLQCSCVQGGRILLSGLVIEDETEVMQAAQLQGLHLLLRMERTAWISLLFGK